MAKCLPCLIRPADDARKNYSCGYCGTRWCIYCWDHNFVCWSIDGKGFVCSPCFSKEVDSNYEGRYEL